MRFLRVQNATTGDGVSSRALLRVVIRGRLSLKV
jgi:hypothetical protein